MNKLLLAAAAVLVAVQFANAQAGTPENNPPTPAQIADCTITESAYWQQRMARATPSTNNALTQIMAMAAANAIAERCSHK